MPPLISRALTLILVLATSAVFSVAEAPATPWKDSELLALVAGGALTENIVNEIQLRGLAFHPSDDYLSRLQTAGAESTLLTALKNAKISAPAESSEDPHHVEFTLVSRVPRPPSLGRDFCGFAPLPLEAYWVVTRTPAQAELGRGTLGS